MACCPSVIGPQFIIIGHDKPTRDMLTRVSTPVACVGQGNGTSSVVHGLQYSVLLVCSLQPNHTRLELPISLPARQRRLLTMERFQKDRHNRPPVMERTMLVVTPECATTRTTYFLAFRPVIQSVKRRMTSGSAQPSKISERLLNLLI